MFRRLWIRRRQKWSSWTILVCLCAGLFLTYHFYSRDSSSSVSNKLAKKKQAQVDSLLLDHAESRDGPLMDPADVLAYRKHRYQQYQSKPAGSGPGEKGLGVKLSREEQVQADILFEKEAFNIIASDMIALDRSVKDTRDPR